MIKFNEEEAQKGIENLKKTGIESLTLRGIDLNKILIPGTNLSSLSIDSINSTYDSDSSADENLSEAVRPSRLFWFHVFRIVLAFIHFFMYHYERLKREFSHKRTYIINYLMPPLKLGNGNEDADLQFFPAKKTYWYPATNGEYDIFPTLKHFPHHVAIIFQKEELIVSPPPPIPQAYVSADKKLITPSNANIIKAKLQQSLYKRKLAQHSRSENKLIQFAAFQAISICLSIKVKKSEKLRVNSIKQISLYERSGESWTNEKDLCELIAKDIKDGYLAKNHPLPIIRIIKPSENSIWYINSIGTITKEDKQGAFEGFTVVLLSEKDTAALLISKISEYNKLIKTGTLDPKDLTSDFIFNQLEDYYYGKPDLILRGRSPYIDLGGYPSYMAENAVLCINDFDRNPGIHFFVSALHYYNSECKYDYKIKLKAKKLNSKLEKRSGPSSLSSEDNLKKISRKIEKTPENNDTSSAVNTLPESSICFTETSINLQTKKEEESISTN